MQADCIIKGSLSWSVKSTLVSNTDYLWGLPIGVMEKTTDSGIIWLRLTRERIENRLYMLSFCFIHFDNKLTANPEPRYLCITSVDKTDMKIIIYVIVKAFQSAFTRDAQLLNQPLCAIFESKNFLSLCNTNFSLSLSRSIPLQLN